MIRETEVKKWNKKWNETSVVVTPKDGGDPKEGAISPNGAPRFLMVVSFSVRAQLQEDVLCIRMLRHK